MDAIKEKIGVLPIESIAKSTKFRKRKPKKITSEAYLLSFVKCVFNGNISQAAWAKELSKQTGQPISEQALQNTVQIRQEEFSRELLKRSVQQVIETKVNSHKSCGILASFTSVKIHDSTCIQLPQGLIDAFPGSSSQNGSNAMARIQLSMDLLRGDYSRIAITGYRENDQSYAMKLAQSAIGGELHLFDLGYFKIAALREIIKAKAYFLSRYKSRVSIFKGEGEKALDLVGHLKKTEKKGMGLWDAPVTIGADEKLPVRIIAIKVPQNVAQARRRKKLNHRDSRKKYSQDYLYLLGWNIFITNLPNKRLQAKQVLRIYGLRWRIEIIFKAWKSKLSFAALFKKQSYGLPSRGVIQLNLVLLTITMFLTRWYKELFQLVFDKTGKLLSILKFAELVKRNLDYLNHMYHNNLDNLLKLLSYHYTYDVRKDRVNFIEVLYNKKLT